MPLNSSQIVYQAAVIAKGPGMIALAGQMLNLTLEDLWLHRDLKVNRVTSTLSIQANSNGPFNLESDYARTYDLFYLVNGDPFFLNQITQEQMDMEIISPQVDNYPYEFSTDMSPLATGLPATLTIYPQSVTQLSMTHRYMIRRADIVTPESDTSVPWFEDQDYLIHATATRMMKITDDARWEAFVVEGENLLRKHLLMQGDEQKAVITVGRDPRRFRDTQRLPSTKTQPM